MFVTKSVKYLVFIMKSNIQYMASVITSIKFLLSLNKNKAILLVKLKLKIKIYLYS